MELPAGWTGRRLAIFLERVHWFSELWVEGRMAGACDSLSVPHRFEFVAPAGRFRLALRVDNTPRIPIGRICHALTDWTQTNWNGVIGRMTLYPADEGLADVRVAADRDRLTVTGLAGMPGRLKVSAGSRVTEHDVRAGPFRIEGDARELELWSPREPNGFEATVSLEGASVTVRAGRSWIAAEGKRILWNGEPLFLRGTLECCVFPKTGYPPTDEAAWEKVMTRAKAFGLNHMRFHSWCPPEAAFAAADAAGIIVQVELPLWTGTWPVSSDAALLDFCRREALSILAEYGHHPSFGLFALGNEIAFYGQEPAVDGLINELRAAHPNRLYTFSAHGTHLSAACDYYVQADNGKPGVENRPLRGSTWFGVGSRFTREPPSTLVTCDEAAAQFDRPVLSHEVGEWAVFPDVHHADRYNGVLEPRNFRTIAAMLDRRGMLELAPAFVRTSGRLSATLYKEEVETLLRTRGLSGFQLLGLTDFPGQGTATVGVLDAFWEEKGFMDAAEFRSFCADTVPLLEVSKFVWTSEETFRGEASVFHAGRRQAFRLRWRVRGPDGEIRAKGVLPGTVCGAGERGRPEFVEIPLSELPAPARYRFELDAGSGHCNAWPLWVLPTAPPQLDIGDLIVGGHYREDVRTALRSGRAVWLRLNPKRMWSGLPGRFDPAFWSPIHFKEQVGTMGTLIQAHHPAFDEFPTEEHTEWQWWDILSASRALCLNALPLDYRPLVQVIDRYERNDKLGTLFEARVGSGRLFVSAVDFDDLDGRPAARQLEYSIQSHLTSPRFDPKQAVTLDALDTVFLREP